MPGAVLGGLTEEEPTQAADRVIQHHTISDSCMSASSCTEALLTLRCAVEVSDDKLGEMNGPGAVRVTRVA